MWTQQDAIELCRRVELICPAHGAHVALTGGCLYRDGERKDCDLVFYRIRQRDDIDTDSLWQALALIGLNKVSGGGFIVKATYRDKSVDCLFPEEIYNEEYPT